MVPEEGVVFCFVLPVQHLFEERVTVGEGASPATIISP